MKKGVLGAFILVATIGLIGSTHAAESTINVSLYMDKGISTKKAYYTKDEACLELKDNRYNGPEIAITWTNSTAKGYILFKKQGEIFYAVNDVVVNTIDAGVQNNKITAYMYKYNCKTKKATQLITSDELNKIAEYGNYPMIELSLLGYDNGTFLFLPAAGIGAKFSEFIVRNNTTKKEKSLDVSSYSDILNIKNFSSVFLKHIEAIQSQVKGQQVKDIVNPTCDFGGPCTFDQSRGELLLKKWDSKNNQKIFMNSITGEPRGMEWGGLSIESTRGLTSTVSFNFTVWVKKIGTPVKTTVSYNWLTNSFDTKTIKTVIGKKLMYDEKNRSIEEVK